MLDKKRQKWADEKQQSEGEKIARSPVVGFQISYWKN
jgi:hypothetical protein